MVAEVAVNPIALIASALAMVVLGALWYGPLFGKQWMKLMGMDPQKVKVTPEMQNQMMKSMAGMLVASLVLVFVLTHTLAYAGVKTISDALFVAFMTWLGYVATIELNGVFFEKKKVQHYLINVAYYLVGFLMMSIIIVSL